LPPGRLLKSLSATDGQAFKLNTCLVYSEPWTIDTRRRRAGLHALSMVLHQIAIPDPEQRLFQDAPADNFFPYSLKRLDT
jgi:hypothetical protein